MSNITETSPLLTASLSHFAAERDRLLAELDIYLNRPVATGNVTGITSEVFSLFQKLNETQGTIELVRGIIDDNKREKMATLLTELDKAKSKLDKKKN